jgi:hypothetical protein
LLIKTDAIGNEIWRNALGGTIDSKGNSIELTMLSYSGEHLIKTRNHPVKLGHGVIKGNTIRAMPARTTPIDACRPSTQGFSLATHIDEHEGYLLEQNSSYLSG